MTICRGDDGCGRNYSAASDEVRKHQAIHAITSYINLSLTLIHPPWPQSGIVVYYGKIGYHDHESSREDLWTPWWPSSLCLIRHKSTTVVLRFLTTWEYEANIHEPARLPTFSVSLPQLPVNQIRKPLDSPCHRRRGIPSRRLSGVDAPSSAADPAWQLCASHALSRTKLHAVHDLKRDIQAMVVSLHHQRAESI